jgi:arylsulfatase A-like enzyme
MRSHRPRFVTCVLGIGLVTTAAVFGCQKPEADDAPKLASGKNLLLISLDSMRADHMTALGGRARLTENLDALAGRSSLFTNARSESNITNPSHLTIMTGLRAIEHGVSNNRRRIPEDLDMLSLAAKRAGYRTAGFVSIPHLAHHLGWNGFDEFPEVKRVLDANLITDLALKWLQSGDSQPFFLWTHYFDPHTPYEPPEPLARGLFKKAKLNNRERYAAEIFFMDREIGRLLDGLEAGGHSEDTVIIVVGDHGESLGEHGIFYSHAGLYEPQLRIPIIFHVPGLPPRRHDESVTTLDLLPTITEFMGIGLEHQASGQTLGPMIRGESPPGWEDRIMVHQNAHNRGVAARKGRWKLIWPLGSSKDGRLPEAPVLFDLETDPKELTDVAALHPDRVDELKTFIDPWIQQGLVLQDEEPPHLSKEALERLEALGYAN